MNVGHPLSKARPRSTNATRPAPKRVPTVHTLLPVCAASLHRIMLCQHKLRNHNLRRMRMHIHCRAHADQPECMHALAQCATGGSALWGRSCVTAAHGPGMDAGYGLREGSYPSLQSGCGPGLTHETHAHMSYSALSSLSSHSAMPTASKAALNLWPSCCPAPLKMLLRTRSTSVRPCCSRARAKPRNAWHDGPQAGYEVLSSRQSRRGCAAAVCKAHLAQGGEAGQAAQGAGVQGAPDLQLTRREPPKGQRLQGSEHAHALR